MKTYNQYVMYGILVPIATQERWDLGGDTDISVLFNTRDGEAVIIGKILKESSGSQPIGYDEPLALDNLKLNDVDELIIRQSVEEKFGVKGKFEYYLVSQIRNK